MMTTKYITISIREDVFNKLLMLKPDHLDYSMTIHIMLNCAFPASLKKEITKERFGRNAIGSRTIKIKKTLYDNINKEYPKASFSVFLNGLINSLDKEKYQKRVKILYF